MVHAIPSLHHVILEGLFREKGRAQISRHSQRQYEGGKCPPSIQTMTCFLPKAMREDWLSEPLAPHSWHSLQRWWRLLRRFKMWENKRRILEGQIPWDTSFRFPRTIDSIDLYNELPGSGFSLVSMISLFTLPVHNWKSDSLVTGSIFRFSHATLTLTTLILWEEELFTCWLI